MDIGTKLDECDSSLVWLTVTSASDVVSLRLTKIDMLTILQRALNTWSDAPKEFFEFSDKLDKV